MEARAEQGRGGSKWEGLMAVVWGIADLHLRGRAEGGRGRFGKGWGDHLDRIERNWRGCVAAEDLVLMPGDFSGARTHWEVQADLAWLEGLPGLKVLSAGNHDRWWNRVEAIRPLLRRSQRAVGGDAVEVGGVVVCGTRGVPPRGADAAEVARELEALDRALEEGNRLRATGESLFVLWHYPPFDSDREPGPVVGRLERAGVTACVYGHVHRSGDWSAQVQGVVGGIRYACVAADAIGFRPLRIATWGEPLG